MVGIYRVCLLSNNFDYLYISVSLQEKSSTTSLDLNATSLVIFCLHETYLFNCPFPLNNTFTISFTLRNSLPLSSSYIALSEGMEKRSRMSKRFHSCVFSFNFNQRLTFCCDFLGTNNLINKKKPTL